MPVIKRTKRLRRLLDSGLSPEFPQRLQSCFQYLDQEQLGFYSLRDLTERGDDVFRLLGVPLADHSVFAVMDTFRRIDVDGSGRIEEVNVLFTVL